jgi:aspartyl protease family protein
MINVRAGIACLAGTLIFSSSAMGAVGQSYMIFDGQSYTTDQIDQAVSSPVIRQMQRLLPNEAVAIARAADGHYYVNGQLNGFPMTFIVDTGASVTCIPSYMAKNAGIRAGLVGLSRTAAGPSPVSTSKGNVVRIANFTFNSATICVQKLLESPLLGAELLNTLKIVFQDGWMVISKP